jgi:predicted DNA-binding transcriptional regulator YafY
LKRARGQEVIRQWKLLKETEAARYGLGVEQLAERLGVTSRTIRRDLSQLQEAGFPLEQHQRDTRRTWSLNRETFKGLMDSGLTLSELCALYFSRALTEFAAGTPFRQDLASAFEKFEQCLTPAQLKYLEDFPKVLAAKPEPRKKAGVEAPSHVGRLTTAALEHRRVSMTYHSFHSRKVKSYVIEPYQLYYAQGGLYVLAVVPAYGETRQFAIERIKTLHMTDERFVPDDTVDVTRDANSLGVVLGGKPEAVTIEFQPEAAPYVAEREYHPSQSLEMRDDGCLVLKMRVAVDFALSAWVLGFGPRARVLAPRRLAQVILEQIEDMRANYAPPLPGLAASRRQRAQKGLPFTTKAR